MSTHYSLSLTKGKIAFVSPEDYTALHQVGRWCFSNSGYMVHYYTEGRSQTKTLYAHRFTMERILGQAIPFGLQVDHVDQNRLNNQRGNLRLATRSQNQAHKGLQHNNSSQYKGVNRSSARWEARLKYGDKRLHLGRYDTPLEAALVYDAASRLLNRQFAGVNFPDLPTPPEVMERLVDRLTRYGLSVRHLISERR